MSEGANGVYGRAGGSLKKDGASFSSASAARAGAKGEQRTADVLSAFRSRCAIIHDLNVPIPGFKSNLDHVIVTGKHVYLLDTKEWKPGFYWSLGGHGFRGLARTPHITKSPSYALDALASALKGTGAKVHRTAFIIVWPSSIKKTLRLSFLRATSTKFLHANRLSALVEKWIVTEPADPAIVSRLNALRKK